MGLKTGLASRGLRIAASAFLVAGLAAGVAAAPVLAPAAHAAVLVTDEQAQAQAESTGQPVLATADSTATETTTANPDGTFTADESAAPVQELVNGTWTPLSASLVQNSDGSYSPAVSDQQLTLSGGGGTTIATMTADNRTLALSWPTALPAPSVSGPTATYPNVLPGVDLQVTADTDGGFSDDLIVHNAAAAANPALASLALPYSTAGGLVLSGDGSGGLTAAAAAGDPPLISFGAPQIWDSAPPPAGETLITSTDGVTVDAGTGDPAYSTTGSPGTGAAVATVPVTVSGTTITLAPPASILTGPATVYPVHIHKTWGNSAHAGAAKWTQIFSGKPDANRYGIKEDLRVGACPYDLPQSPCNGIGVAHTYLTVNLPPKILRAGTVIHQVTMNTTEDFAPSCTQEDVRLWAVPGTISTATNWTNAPALSGPGTGYDTQHAAKGYPGCGYKHWDLTFNVATSFITSDIGHQSYQTFALQAADEDTGNIAVSGLYWKKFKYSDFNLVITYNYPPDRPAFLSTSPGGGCSTSPKHPRVIGNDDVIFSSYAKDADGDQHLTTTLNLYRPGVTTPVFTTQMPPTPNNSTAKTPILKAAWYTFGTNGSTTEYEYYYQTQVTDEFGLSSSLSDQCWILYNPKGPQKPTVTYSSDTAVLGQTVSASFSSPGCSPATNPCPAEYVYQEGAGRPVPVPLTGGATSWSGPIQVTQTGPITFTVYSASAAGNPSAKDTQTIKGTIPSTPYNDGYFTGKTYPDLLQVGPGSKGGLWLYQGTGNGTVHAPTDIGSAGNRLNPGIDGDKDWLGAIALHGDFTGHHVQDVLAYYPPGNSQGVQAGTGVIVFGNGSSAALDPGQSYNMNLTCDSPQHCDPMGTPPIQLTPAGNASGMATGTEDLLGIDTDGKGQAELDLFTNGTSPNSSSNGGYQFCNTITPTAPGGSSDNWSHYLITTAGTSAQLLFALNTSTHVLYETASPLTLITTAGNSSPACSDKIAQPAWTKITAPATLTGLNQADINHRGQVEIWDFEGGEPVSYTLSGATLSQEAVNTAPLPANAWALTDGNPDEAGATATSALDSITGASATLTGNAAWAADSTFATDLNLDGTSGYVTPDSTTITSPVDTISVWFNTTSPGVLVSAQGQPLSAGATTTGSYNPVLYIGTDGRLYGEILAGTDIAPAVSSSAVDDGLWHQAVLTISQQSCTPACADNQTLYIDNKAPVRTSLTGPLPGTWTNVTFGAGYIGGSWPNYPSTNAPSGTAGISYFNGDLSGIEFFNTALSDGGSVYVPVSPVRIIDTRSAYNIGPVTGPVAGNATITVPIAGNTIAGLPSAGITAAAIAVTITNQTGAGNLIFYPDGTPQPATSNLNFTASGGNITNDAIVPVGPDGKIAIYNSSAGTDEIIVDLTGYFTTSTSTANASTYTPLPDPTRILDTRVPTGVPAAGQIPGGGTLTLTIAGDNTNGAGIPASGVTAVALNLTAVAPTGDSGFLVAYPDGISPPPGVTLLNYQGAANPNAGTVIITVPVGPDGKIDIYNASPTPTNLVGDLSGYFSNSAAGQYYHSLDSTRILDTRQTSPLGAHTGATIETPSIITADNPTLVLNITATDESTSGDLQAFPSSAAQPISSILNYAAGVSIANLALVNTATSGSFIIQNQSSGTTDIIIDVSGYFQ